MNVKEKAAAFRRKVMEVALSNEATIDYKGLEFKVLVPSMRKAMQFENSDDPVSDMLRECVADPDGVKVFEDASAEELGELPGDFVAKVVGRLKKFTEEAEGN